MKTATFFAALMLVCGSLLAQHPLVGTWKLISVKGISADGNPFSLDSTQIHETKVITPTHYILIAEDVRGDSLIFNRSYAGTIRFDGAKFFESPFQASIPIFDGVKTDFTWKVEGNIFTQSGSIIRPDGKKVVLEALKFTRIEKQKGHTENPAIGAWTLKSSNGKKSEGQKSESTGEQITQFQLITATHWMQITHENGKFTEAIGGPYQYSNGKMIALIREGKSQLQGDIELTEHVTGDQLFSKAVRTGIDGKTVTSDNIFERVKGIN